MDSVIEKLIIGAVGGLVAFWFTYRKFISQRWWDKQFDLYIEAIDILKIIEHSLAIYEWELNNNQTIDTSETLKKAYLDFEEGLNQLHGLQSKMMLIGLDDAHTKLMVLRAALTVVHPSLLTSETDEDHEEIINLIKQSKDMTGGCSTELAFIGKKNLGTEIQVFKKIKLLFKSLNSDN
ncbi:MAG: hypothetical protein L3J52_01680 [Proteobacteria bacterium]|nr:hypothetical protein [Pseudomonadota bacterium]